MHLEVTPTDGGYRWQLITEEGRVIYSPPFVFSTDLDAFKDGKRYKSVFHLVATQVDRPSD